MKIVLSAAVVMTSAVIGAVHYALPEDNRLSDETLHRLATPEFPVLDLTQPDLPPAGGVSKTLIKQVADKYDVPAGALYGIWSVESHQLKGGWGTGKGWLRAADIVRRGGACTAKYGRAWCLRHWNSLVALCGQTRADGSKVCDPYQVRTSYALAMGPMQHIPAEVIRIDDGGRGSWTDRAADYDSDGVVDPHSLPDAMAMTALFLRHNYAKYGDWRKAVNAYYGSQSEGYAEGTRAGFKGVIGYWRDWCQDTKDCD